MSFAIGRKIEELRCAKGITKEKMAEVLETSRQRYARLEGGQTDISFVIIKKIADYLGVPTRTITQVEEDEKGLVARFREKTDTPEAVASVARVEEILKVFHAHEKLYFQMKVRDRVEN